MLFGLAIFFVPIIGLVGQDVPLGKSFMWFLVPLFIAFFMNGWVAKRKGRSAAGPFAAAGGISCDAKLGCRTA